MAKGHTGEFFRRRDEWRKHPMLSNRLRHATPGLGIALVAFGIFLGGEQGFEFLVNENEHMERVEAGGGLLPVQEVFHPCKLLTSILLLQVDYWEN